MRFRSTALVNEVAETGAGKGLSVYKTKGGIWRERGDKIGVNTEGITRQGKEGRKSIERRNSLGAMHPNIPVVKPV